MTLQQVWPSLDTQELPGIQDSRVSPATLDSQGFLATQGSPGILVSQVFQATLGLLA
jgi:hypothetical protein